jgi:tRNA (adenine22-N1)-methyltransferase
MRKNHDSSDKSGNAVILSSRLSSLAAYVIKGEPAADIGSDHAQLACYLVSSGICPRAICGELGDGPYRRSFHYVDSLGLTELINVRQGDGLEVLNHGEAATVVIAGLGGNTICDILRANISKTQSFERILVQPAGPLLEVRSLAAERGWEIIDESVVKAGKHFYVNIALAPCSGKPYRLSEKELRWGPRLLAKKDEPAVRVYLQSQIDKYSAIIGQITADAGARAFEVKNTYQRIKEDLEETVHDHNTPGDF